MVEDSNQDLMIVIRAFGALLCGVSVLIAIVGQKLVWLARGVANSDFVIEFDISGSNGRGSIVQRIGGYKNSSSTSKNGSRNSSTHHRRTMSVNSSISSLARVSGIRVSKVMTSGVNTSMMDSTMMVKRDQTEFLKNVSPVRTPLPKKASSSTTTDDDNESVVSHISHTVVRDMRLSRAN
eukprot:TRINITY_DN3489_c0_g1_i4.p1 TRINITY_DN3489_c0_g1~~TRINITY_DN3489_c0_g1_i4.p1  ORF type:complete len:180 (-),score=50.60 TRINITY_DN3489_c0_g1_i4:744-1283(-)